MDILVTGSRDWHDSEFIKLVLNSFAGEKVLLMHGNCEGADRLAACVAIGLDAEGVFELVGIEPYDADWGTHGRAAGPIRNQQMIEMQPDIVLAFHRDLDASKGTADCVRRALKAGIPVLLNGMVYAEEA